MIVLCDLSNNMSDNKYKKRGGTTDLGKFYEDYYLAFTVLKLLKDNNVEDFRISTNDAKFGAFDDLVLETKYRNKSEGKYAIQLKHKEKKDLSISNLKTNKLSIWKYYQSFQECNHLLSDYNIILFTNAKFKIDKNNVVDLWDDKDGVKVRIITKDPYSMINTSNGKCYQFHLDSENSEEIKEKYKHFFKRFSLYTNQMDVQKLKQGFVHSLRTLTSDSHVADKILKFISEWNLMEGIKNKLTKDMMIKVITLHVLDGLIYPHDFCEVNKEKKIVQKAISNFNIAAFNSESLETVVKIWGDAKNQLRSFDIKKINEIRRQFIQFDIQYITNIDNLPDKEATEVLWVMDKCPLIVKDHPSIYETAKLCGKKSKFVIITDKLNDRKLGELTIFKTLSDLKGHKFTYNDILKNLSFRLFGEKTNLENLIKEDNNFENLITIDDIAKMTNTDLIRSQEELCYPYVDRHLYKIIVDPKYLETVKENTMVLLSNVNDKQKLKHQFPDFKTVATNETILLLPQKQNILIFKTTETSRDEFKSLNEKHGKYQTCHHFRYHDVYLEWIESIGDVSDLQKFRIKNESFVKDEKQCAENIRNNLNIIVGDPGMGKSFFAKRLKNSLSSKYFTVLIQPIDVPALCRFVKYPENLQGFFTFVIKSKYSNCGNFEKHVLKLLMERGKTVFLWDALDELSDQNRNLVERLIAILSKNSIAQFLMSRGFLGKQLECKFQVLCEELQPFNSRQQTKYIQRRLRDICSREELESITTAVKKNIAETSYRDILSIPLQIYMLTELFRQDLAKYKTMFTELFIITDLYSHFIKEKFNLYFKIKKGFPESINEEKHIKRLIKCRIKNYQQTSITLLFGTTFNKEPNTEMNNFLKEIKNDGDEFGLITAVDVNMQPEFLHKSYAEYFGATYLAKNCRNIPYLENVIFDRKHANVRYFFDTLLAKNSPVHIAVLCKNLHYLQNCEDGDKFKRKDLLGRNALHLAASWGERYPLLKMSESRADYETFGVTITIDSNVKFETKKESSEYHQIIHTLLKNCDVHEKDQLFHSTPTMYAEKCECLFAAALIGKKQENKNYLKTKNENFVYSLLYYAIKYGIYEILDLFENIKFTVAERRNSLLHIAAEHNQLHYLRKLLSLEVYRKNIDYGNWFCETALLIAAKKGYLETVKLLIQENADVDAIDSFDWTPLHAAVEKGHIKTVTYLIQQNANVNAPSNNNRIPLHSAARNGHLEIVKILIQGNANVNAFDNFGATPLHSSASNGHFETVKYLIQQNANVRAVSKNGITPLHVAAFSGHFEIVKYLIQENANVSAKANNGKTPLHLAIENGRFKTAKYLIQQNADVNAVTKNYQTPLHLAIKNEHLDTVKYLVRKNANVNAVDGHGCTPLFTAVLNRYFEAAKYLIQKDANVNAVDNNGCTPLHRAAFNGHLETVKFLIQENANVNAVDNNGCTPLHRAAFNGHLETVKYFIQEHANLNAVDENSQTPLHLSAENGHFETVIYLIQKNANVNAVDNNGGTPLHRAAFNGHLESVKFLIQGGATVNAVSNDGWTPLHAAALNGHLETVKYLIQEHANVNAIDKDGWTPLRRAKQNRQFEIVQHLKKIGCQYQHHHKQWYHAFMLTCFRGGS